jgi:hypothetical protein
VVRKREAWPGSRTPLRSEAAFPNKESAVDDHDDGIRNSLELRIDPGVGLPVIGARHDREPVLAQTGVVLPRGVAHQLTTLAPVGGTVRLAIGTRAE